MPKLGEHLGCGLLQAQVFGSSPKAGERSPDFEEEVGVIAEAVGDAFDDFDANLDSRSLFLSSAQHAKDFDMPLLPTVAVLATLLATAQPDDYARQWVRLANEHLLMVKTEPGKSYELELIKAHSTFWHAVSSKCKREAVNAGIDKFSAIAVLDRDGKVVEFLTLPDSPKLSCYEKQMVGRRYPAPPFAPFYELINTTIK